MAGTMYFLLSHTNSNWIMYAETNWNVKIRSLQFCLINIKENFSSPGIQFSNQEVPVFNQEVPAFNQEVPAFNQELLGFDKNYWWNQE